MAQKKKSAGGSNDHLGVVLAAVAAIAAGVYFFGTKKGNKQRVALQDWVVKAEEDVMKRLDSVGEVNKDAYEAIVDSVLVNYKKAKKVNDAVLNDLRTELYSQWSGIEQGAKRGAVAGKGIAKHVAKKAKKIVRTVKE